MTKLINIYGDESCHLSNDDPNQRFMILGGISCPFLEKNQVFKDIRKIKKDYNLPDKYEIKWTKISRARIDFYIELVQYFFDKDFLNFRAVIIDKNLLDYDLYPLMPEDLNKYSSPHDKFYYKMYYLLLIKMFESQNSYNIFIDIKDSQSSRKNKKLEDICNQIRKDVPSERPQEIIIKQVRSHEVELIQLTDLFIGALSYINRGLSTNIEKIIILKKIQELAGYPLIESTYPSEIKFNILKWKPKGGICV